MGSPDVRAPLQPGGCSPSEARLGIHPLPTLPHLARPPRPPGAREPAGILGVSPGQALSGERRPGGQGSCLQGSCLEHIGPREVLLAASRATEPFAPSSGPARLDLAPGSHFSKPRPPPPHSATLPTSPLLAPGGLPAAAAGVGPRGRGWVGVRYAASVALAPSPTIRRCKPGRRSHTPRPAPTSPGAAARCPLSHPNPEGILPRVGENFSPIPGCTMPLLSLQCPHTHPPILERPPSAGRAVGWAQVTVGRTGPEGPSPG